ncbi:hypothetical protein [Granulicella sp. 5B5]|uniref:hypothetical protein n=1 Tax=Granulicella sp. 5B5 TaxID=1617967 RepID=UPI0015F77C8D|nr:hypothetical protein [Granulicella sp. 5B5]
MLDRNLHDRNPRPSSSEPAPRGPQLVVAPPPRPSRHSALALWHLLSLDAPTVAALWTFFIARCSHIALPWTASAAMFTAVWMIYAADRLLDARQLDTTPHTPTDLADIDLASIDIEERHRFHHRHRARFLAGMAAASLALVLLLPHLQPRALLLYTLLAALLGTWMLLIHARPPHRDGTRRLPKELAVGIFFPAACFIPTVARAPSLQPQLLPIAAIFAGVCTLNCLFLYTWEHPHEPLARRHAHWTTLWSIRHLPQLSVALLALCITLAALDRFATAPALACALSTALLLALHRLRTRIRPVHLRAAADLVLLSPLLFLLHR